MIVRPGGGGGLNRQELLLLWLSVAVTLLLNAALNQSDRAEPGARLRAAATAAAAWAMGMLLLPILFVYGAYATRMLGNTIRLGGEVPAHLVGLACTGALMGLVTSAIAEHGRRSARRGL